MKNVSEYKLKKVNSDFPKEKISSSRDAEKFIRQFYSDDIEIYESFFILLLNRRNVTTGYAKISQGGTAGTVVDVKILAKYAVDSLAHGVILAHNHPSGEVDPSKADIQLTKKVKDALSLLSVEVLDHLIVGVDKYLSFADEGLL